MSPKRESVSARVVVIGHPRAACDALARALAANGGDDLDVWGCFDSEASLNSADAPQSADVAVVLAPPSEVHRYLLALAEPRPTFLKAIVLCARPEDEDLVRWARTGIAGLAVGDPSLKDLPETLLSLARGALICDQGVAAALLQHISTIPQRAVTGGSGRNKLTRREREVAELICDGLSNKDIARVLVISMPTVKAHVHSILAKLNLNRRTDLIIGNTKGPI